LKTETVDRNEKEIIMQSNSSSIMSILQVIKNNDSTLSYKIVCPIIRYARLLQSTMV
jgi:hypothetical protein